MEAANLPAAGLNPEAGAAGATPEKLPPQVEAGEQSPGQIVIKEGFCEPWAEDKAIFDPVQAGWERAAKNLSAKIQEMLASPEVALSPDGLTPAQAAAKERARLLGEADTRAAELAKYLTKVREDIVQAAAESPPPALPAEPLPPSDIAIDQLQEATPIPVPTPVEEPASVSPAVESSPELVPTPLPVPEAGSPLDQLLKQVPAEMRQEITQRLSEFGENFDEKKFAREHQEEYTLINQVITEAGDPAKAAEAAGKVKAYLDNLDSQEDGDKKKKDFLVNLFGIYKRRLNQEENPEKKEELKKSMLGLNKELAGLGVGSLGGILEVIIGAIVGEVQEQLK